ncbi:hypothetical protein FRB94_003465 [Tulasnella sp. JGI-2019a]|nr:hypothetical protein FRB94_003465 [Tulasnella sp. JGI-2019a]
MSVHPGKYRIVASHAKDMCLEASKYGEDSVKLDYNTGGPNQIFEIVDKGGMYNIIGQTGLKLAGPENSSTGACTMVQGWENSLAAEWNFEGMGNGSFYIMNTSSGNRLSVKGGVRDVGSDLVVSYKMDQEHCKFELQRA